ncbi:MAG TPA: MoaD/ThiS family protein [Acidimicrobiales bacterium]|nr:MoaD/ThiS family protein [Acidimicrobiales bacterium]
MTTVRLPAQLREYAEGHATIDVEPDGGPLTVGAVLDFLESRYPLVGRRIRDEQGGIRRHVHVYVGEDRVRSLGDAIAEGAVVTILPAVSGG